MRLNPKEQQAIRKTISQLDKDALIYLFGSRVVGAILYGCPKLTRLFYARSIANKYQHLAKSIS